MHHVYEDAARQTVGEEYSVGKSRRIRDGNILPSLLLGGYFSPHTVLVRRKVLDRVGLFDPELGGHADWDLWLRIAATGYPVQYVDEKLVYYRIHAHNMSANVEHMRTTRLLALRKLFRLFPDAAAGATEDLYRIADELFVGNRTLQDQLETADARVLHCEAELSRIQAELAQLQQAHREVERLRGVEERFEAYFRDTQAWIASLSEAKKWHQQQSEHWRQEAERLASEPSQETPQLEDKP